MFYLGMIHLEGKYVAKDPETALTFFIEGAARNNAYCYYELSRIYGSEDNIIDEMPDERPSKSLQFLYLKRSAEEGFVHAQHMLGQAYRKGELVKKDDHRALAWLRECIRNGGSPLAYIEAGELLL